MEQHPIPMKSPMPFAEHRPYSSATASAGKRGLIVPLYLALIAGTGGTYATVNLPRALAIYRNPIFEIRGQREKHDQVLSIAQHLTSIRETLGLTMSDIAKIFDVTRPTVYSWFGGSNPRPEIRLKICRLSTLSDEFRAAGISRVGIYLRRPIGGNGSLLDLLKSDADLNEAVASIKSTAMQTRDKLRVVGPASRRVSVGLDEISTHIDA
jgi:DNA-binding XRE family transcriptional regulator